MENIDNLHNYEHITSEETYEPVNEQLEPYFYIAPAYWMEVLGIFPTEFRGATYYQPLFYYVPVYNNFLSHDLVQEQYETESTEYCPSDSYPSADSVETGINETSAFCIPSEVNDWHPEEISETIVHSDRNVGQVHLDIDNSKDEDVENDSPCTDDEDCVVKNNGSFNDDEERITDDDCGSNSSWFDVSETVDGLNSINANGVYDDGIGKKKNDSSHIVGEDRGIEAGDSNSSFFDVTEKYGRSNPINANGAYDDGISKKKDESYHHGDEDCSKEAGDFKLTWFDVCKKSDVVHPTDENQGALDDDTDKKEDNNYCKDDEDRVIQANASSSFCFDVSENTIDEKESVLNDSSGKEENDSSQNNADVRGMQMDDSDVTEKGYVVNPIQVDEDFLGDGSDKKKHGSSRNKDEDDGPVITLADILASEEYWKVKREEYWQKRRSRDLYRSALEGEIRPRKNLPNVGTLSTIFEDLPYPVNHPYDAGEDTFIDEYFDLKPLEVKKSESSSSAVVPKKKRFRNTRKMFSRMFRCFKPKTPKESKPP